MREPFRAVRLAISSGLLAMGLGAGPVSAEVVNIDIQGDVPNDTLHSGADGVLSVIGSVWNDVEAGVDAFGLQDETGAATGYDLVFTSATGITDSSSANDLQDSGTSGSFSLVGLSAGIEYDVAIYAFPFSLIGFTDSTGATGVLCSATPTYVLPGTENSDYCLFQDVMPADLGGGDFGFTIAGADGATTGVQLSGPGGGAVAVPALTSGGTLALALCLFGAVRFAVRRTTKQP